MRSAQLHHGVRHRRAGAAGADLHDPLPLDVRQTAAKALLEPHGVGVVAGAPAFLQHHRVDRPECPRVVGQLVQQRDHRLLAGKSDVEAVEAHPLGREQQVRQRLGAEIQGLEVDQLVDVAETLLGALLLVHRGGA